MCENDVCKRRANVSFYKQKHYISALIQYWLPDKDMNSQKISIEYKSRKE